jgi:hypothetical protein
MRLAASYGPRDNSRRDEARAAADIATAKYDDVLVAQCLVHDGRAALATAPRSPSGRKPETLPDLWCGDWCLLVERQARLSRSSVSDSVSREEQFHTWHTKYLINEVHWPKGPVSRPAERSDIVFSTCIQKVFANAGSHADC